MTIATTLNRIEYTATAAQKIFPYTFLIFANTDLEVRQIDKITGVTTLLTLTTHYTVSGVGDIGGGNVTLVTGALVDDTIIIVRVMPVTQLIDYVENDSFPADTHEKGLDRATMVSQQLLETLGRAIKLPITSTLEDIDIPVPGAGKHLAWNSAGDALELVTVSESAISSPIAVKGDIIQGDSSGDAEKLAIGTSKQFARVSTGGKVEWVSEPITTKGDIVQGDASGNGARLAIGSSGSLLHVATDLLAYLAAGSNGQILQLASGLPAWVGGLRLVGVNDTEGTTTSTSVVDIVTVSGLSIGVNTPFIVVVALRKSTGTAATASVGLTLNSTQVMAPQTFTDSTAVARTGYFWAFVGPRDGTYTTPGFNVRGSDGLLAALREVQVVPNATVTSVIIRGFVGNADNTMGVKYVKVYALAGA